MKILQKFNLDIKDKINWITWIKWLLGIIFFMIFVWEGKDFLREIYFGKAIHLLKGVSILRVFLYTILGFFATLIVSLYDFAWFYFNPRKIANKKIFKTAFIANAINNVAGMGGIGGAMIRTMFYGNTGLKSNDLLKINALLIPSFFTGLSSLILLSFFKLGAIKNILIHFPILYGIIFLFGMYLFIYLLSEYFNLFNLKQKLQNLGFVGNVRVKISLIIASTFDWFSAGSFLWFIGYQINPNLKFSETIFMFIMSAAISIMSPVPAGIGVLDLLMTIGLQSSGLSGTEALGAVLMYRLFYYILPFISAIFLTFYELDSDGNRIINSKRINHIIYFFEKKLNLSENQLDFIKDITAILLWVLILIAGFFMIIAAVTPALSARIHLIEPFVSLPVIRFSQRTTLLLGIFLVVLSDEIRLKSKRAYVISVVIMVLGTIFILLKGLHIEEMLILTLITGVLIYTKGYFYREYVPFSWARVAKQMIIAQGIISLYILSGQASEFSFNYLHKGAELLYVTPNEYFNKGIILSFLVQGFIICWYLFCHFLPSNLPPWFFQTKSENFEKLDEFLKNNTGKPLTHLIYSGDKYIYISKENKALFAFRPFGNKLIVLGDPIGNTENLADILEEFRLYADLYGYVPVYYQVEEDYLPDYHEIGYTFFKLGEEATIDLIGFDISSSKYKGFRSTRNKFEREGYKFEVSQPSHNKELMVAIKSVSDDWLKDKKEKGFSLGRFDYEYLNRTPLALLYSPLGKIVAFASLLPIYNTSGISVDLMRFSSESPNGTMDYLFTSIFIWANEQGYTNFYMGMAPLSNVGESKYARKEEKMARLLFGSKKTHYNFKGLRQYKEKFHPQWKPKYLAYPTQIRIESTLIEISVMIGSSHKELLKK